jgi:hypothetical protein
VNILERMKGAPVRVDRALAGALDAAVRASRQGGMPGVEVCARILSLWRDAGGGRLEVSARAVLYEGEVALEGKRGGWVLPAFMAGLRTLSLREETREDDIGRLCSALGSLGTSHDALAAFQDWVWSGGGEGLELEMQPSFMEVFELMDSASGLDRQGLRLVRGTALMAVGAEAMMSSVELDVAALRPEFDVELLRYVRAVEGRGFDVDEGETRMLAAVCEEAQGWCREELRAALQIPALQRGLAPGMMANRVMMLVGSGVLEGETLEVLIALGGDSTLWAQAVVRRLEAEGVGAVVGRQAARALERLGDGLGRWMQAWGEESASGCVGALLVAGVALESLMCLPGVVAAVRWSTLEASAARRALELMALCGAGADEQWARWGEMSAAARQEGVLWFVEQVGDLAAHREGLRGYMAVADSVAMRRVVGPLLELHGQAGLALCWDQLVAGHGENWSEAVAEQVFSMCLGLDHCGQRWVGLVVSRRTPLWLRKRALERLRGAPALMEEALRWRWAELFEEPRAAQWLKAERQRLKEAQDER